MGRYAEITYDHEVLEIDNDTNIVLAVHGPYISFDAARRKLLELCDNWECAKSTPSKETSSEPSGKLFDWPEASI